MKLSPDAVRMLLIWCSHRGSSTTAHASAESSNGAVISISGCSLDACCGFPVGGETRSIADYRRAYNAATNQSIVASNFYDRFTENLHELLSDLLEHALEEVAVPHHVSPEFDHFRDVIAADATIFRLQQLLSEFQAIHNDASGTMLYLVHNVTDKTTHESTLIETGS